MSAPFNPYYGRRQPIGPAQNGFAVTPSDGTPLTSIPTRVYVGGAGNLAVIFADDPKNGNSPATGAATQPVILYNVPAGAMLEISVSYIMATGTTASNIVALI